MGIHKRNHRRFDPVSGLVRIDHRDKTNKEGAMASKKSVSVNAASVDVNKSEVFYDIPLEMMIVEEQIRTYIDEEEEPFQALVASIGEKGVLEPVLVTPKDGKYLLVSGARRFLACQKMNLPTIPARVFDALNAKAEILAIQLMENLQREDLDPIDTANALISCFNACHSEVNLDGLLNLFVLYKVDIKRVKSEYVSTLDTLLKVSGKSATSINRMLSLLKLPPEVQSSVRGGELTLTQGYAFAAHLDNPSLMNIYYDCLETPMTQAMLETKLSAVATVQKSPVKAATSPLSRFYSSMKSIKTSLTKSAGNYQQGDLVKLRDDLKGLTDFVEQQLLSIQPQAATAPEALATPPTAAAATATSETKTTTKKKTKAAV
jgi:ParB family chromosome partitioning protein